MTKTYKEILTPRIIINSLIAFGLVFFGAFVGTGGEISSEVIVVALSSGMIAFLTQTRELIKTSKMTKGIFNFV